MNTAERIKEIRLARGWKQRELAARLGVDPQTISRWERGATVPTDLHRVALARIAGVHPDELRAAA